MATGHARRWAAAGIAAAVMAAGAGVVLAADGAEDVQEQLRALQGRISEVEKQDNALKHQVVETEQHNDALRKQLAVMEDREDHNWMTQERSKEIRAVVEGVLAEARSNQQHADGLDIGYNNGFYLQTPDKDFKLQVNGLMDVRYSYVRAENVNHIAGTPLGNQGAGDMSGVSLNTAQLAISGTIFHNVIFKAMGNFGSTASFISPTAGTFQINELWAGYNFSKELNVRAGSLVIPIIPIKTLANYGGSEFPDPAESSVPFGPGYGTGADVYGALFNERMSYDVMFGNGSASQNLVDSTSTTAGTGRDNRFSVYTREQFAGAGKLSDFLDEPDLQNHQDFVWIVGGGLGYESQTTASTAFPGAQTGTQISGLSTSPSPGFLNSKYTLNGSLYRSALDFRSKWRGWSIYGQLLYQQINGDSAPIGGFPHNSVGEFGYFVQSGYFLIPHKLEVAARFGQLMTLGLPNRMEAYTLGVNYYLMGENAKLQFAETYIPNEAGVTDSVGSVVNTQDYITELQFQLKF